MTFPLLESYTGERQLAGCDQSVVGLGPATKGAAFQRALERAGLPRMTARALRDTSTTSMLLNGANAKVVSERLGHSDVALTLRIHSQVTAGMNREAAERLDELYAGAEGGR